MLPIKPLSQRDPRWAKIKLGFSDKTIGEAGCTITVLTMWLNSVMGWSLTPDVVNQRLQDARDKKGKKVGFTGALILWAGIQIAFPEVKWTWRAYNYDNIKPSYYVYVRHLPVLVEVNGAKIGSSKHWILYVGDRKAADPWTGKIVPTSYYPATGYSLIEKS